jgi:hypothetical protein
VATLEGFEALPGAELVKQGLSDLDDGAETPEALLVSMAASRLRAAGVEVPPSHGAAAGHRLYALLASADGATAHSRYNALIARMASFARAAEHAQAS